MSPCNTNNITIHGSCRTHDGECCSQNSTMSCYSVACSSSLLILHNHRGAKVVDPAWAIVTLQHQCYQLLQRSMQCMSSSTCIKETGVKVHDNECHPATERSVAAACVTCSGWTLSWTPACWWKSGAAASMGSLNSSTVPAFPTNKWE